MAVVRILRVWKPVKDVLSYVKNPKKTTEFVKGAEGESILEQNNQNKEVLESCVLVDGINCAPKTATKDMMHVKRKYSKLDGVTVKHLIQSFPRDHISPFIAHEIGMNLAHELWGDKHQVIVATHLDHEENIHNHIVINTISFVDGSYIDYSNNCFPIVQVTSDRLCRQYGLSVMDQPEGNNKPYLEHMAEKNGEYTDRALLRHAIDIAADASTNLETFLDLLDQMGFVVDEGKHDFRIKHIGFEHYTKFSSLGRGYHVRDILDRIDHNFHPEIPVLPPQESPGQILKEEKQPVSEMGYHAVYRCFVKAIEVTIERPETNQAMTLLLANEYRRFQGYKVQLKVLAENHIETDKELETYKEGRKQKLGELIKDRYGLRLALARAKYAGDTPLYNRLHYDIGVLSKQITSCRADIKACGAIAERSERIKEKLTVIEKENFRGKENNQNEHISRSSRSGLANDTKRD